MLPEMELMRYKSKVTTDAVEEEQEASGCRLGKASAKHTPPAYDDIRQPMSIA